MWRSSDGRVTEIWLLRSLEKPVLGDVWEAFLCSQFNIIVVQESLNRDKGDLVWDLWDVSASLCMNFHLWWLMSFLHNKHLCFLLKLWGNSTVFITVAGFLCESKSCQLTHPSKTSIQLYERFIKQSTLMPLRQFRDQRSSDDGYNVFLHHLMSYYCIIRKMSFK